MHVRLEKAFPIDAPAAAAWRVLQDIKSVAECMPGAHITEQIDPTHYHGQVNLKIGPASATFKGSIEIKGTDPAKQQIALFGKGADVKGGSGANMDLTAHIREAGDGKCELVGVSDVSVSGKMANFGGRMLTQVSDQILKQFGANFANRVIASGEGARAQEAAAKVAEQPKALNALALVWQLVAGFFKILFGGKSKSAS